jgi:hypothetical protein
MQPKRVDQDTVENMNQTLALAKRAASVLRQDTGLALTLLYLLMCLVGTVYSILFFLPFKILFLDFAEPTDLLMAAFHDFVAPVAILGPLLILASVLALDIWVRSRFPSYVAISRKLWGDRIDRNSYHWGNISVMLLIYPLAGCLWYANWRTDRILAGKGLKMKVELLQKGQPVEMEAVIIGRTSQFIMLYQHDLKLATTIPLNTLISISHSTRPNKQ